MSWRSVLKSVPALVAYFLLLSFILLLVLKLDHFVSCSCWIVFFSLWVFHAVIARGRFPLPAPSVPHGRQIIHWMAIYIILLVALTVVEADEGRPVLSPESGPLPSWTTSASFDRIRWPAKFYGHHTFNGRKILAVCLIGGMALLVIAVVATCIYKRTAPPPQPTSTTSLTSLPPLTVASGVPSLFHFGPFGSPSAAAEVEPREQPVADIEMQPRESLYA